MPKILEFLKEPKTWYLNTSFNKKLYFSLYLIIIIVIVEIIYILFRIFLDRIGLPFSINNKLVNRDEFGYIFMIILVFYQPIYEELCFRMPLRSEKIGVFISFSLIIGLIIKLIMGLFIDPKNINLINFLILEFLSIGMGVLFIYLFFNSRWLKIKNFINKKYTLYFYLLLFIWVVLHFNSFEISFSHVPILALKFFHLVFLGLIFCSIRLKNGLLYSIILHILYNLAILL